LFVDLFKPILQKTFVEGIVESPLRDQPMIPLLPLQGLARGEKGSGQKEISSHHDASAFCTQN